MSDHRKASTQQLSIAVANLTERITALELLVSQLLKPPVVLTVCKPWDEEVKKIPLSELTKEMQKVYAAGTALEKWEPKLRASDYVNAGIPFEDRSC